jgi:hypothetical protein
MVAANDLRPMTDQWSTSRLPATVGLAAEALSLAAGVLARNQGSIQEQLEMAMDDYLRVLVEADFPAHLSADWRSLQAALSRRPISSRLAAEDARRCACGILRLSEEIREEIVRAG